MWILFIATLVAPSLQLLLLMNFLSERAVDAYMAIQALAGDFILPADPYPPAHSPGLLSASLLKPLPLPTSVVEE